MSNLSLLPFTQLMRICWVAFNQGVEIVIMIRDGKRREIAIPKEAYGIVDHATSQSLRQFLKEHTLVDYIHGNRFNQSLNDMRYIEQYDWVGYGDIKNAHYSSRIFLLLAWNFLFNPILILRHILPLAALYCSPRKSKQALKDTKPFGLRFGLSTTEALFRLTQLNVSKVVYFINNRLLKVNYKFQLYVDDYVFYSDQAAHIETLAFIYKALNRLLLIKVHSGSSPKALVVNSTNSANSKTLERLGLIMFRNKKGELKASIRKKTIDKYLDRIQSDIKSLSRHERAKLVSSVFSKRIGLGGLYIGYGYPLYQAFPPGLLWIDPQQQKRTLSRVIRILKKYVPEFYKLSHKQVRRAIINNWRLDYDYQPLPENVNYSPF